jgi:hypothetical protein
VTVPPGRPPAFTDLDVAVERFYPTDPTSPVTVPPGLAESYGEANVEAQPALAGLLIAERHYYEE